jgi:hypothetical protein
MKITNQQAYAIYQQQQDIKKIDRRHETLQIEERRIHEQIKANDAARIEYNRRMGRNGQNVDILA